MDARAITRLQDGVKLDGATVSFLRVQRHDGGHDKKQDDGKNQWYSVVVGEGKYREVRRMWEAVGCQIEPINSCALRRYSFAENFESRAVGRVKTGGGCEVGGRAKIDAQTR